MFSTNGYSFFMLQILINVANVDKPYC